MRKFPHSFFNYNLKSYRARQGVYFLRGFQNEARHGKALQGLLERYFK